MVPYLSRTNLPEKGHKRQHVVWAVGEQPLSLPARLESLTFPSIQWASSHQLLREHLDATSFDCPVPETASMRRTPAATALSLLILK